MGADSVVSPGSKRTRELDADKPRVVYVVGSGKSGSTILGVTLGNCEDMFFTGELSNWLPASGAPGYFEGAERTDFWRKVREEVRGADELFGSQVAMYLERSFSVFRVYRWRAKRRLRPRYQRVTEDLCRAIMRVAGARYIIDTSHFPMRARELQRIDGIDMYLVFLVRDPRDIVASHTRNAEGDFLRWVRLVLRTNVDLWLTYTLSVFVFLRHRRDRRMLLRHEELIANPQEVLRELLDRVDSDAPIPDLGALRTGMPLRGNRLLKSDVVVFGEPAAPPARRSFVTTLLQLPWILLLRVLRPLGASPQP